MKLKSRIESLLFVNSDPLSFDTISDITGATEDQISQVVESLFKEYNETGRGVNVLKKDRKVQMVANPENSDVVQELTDQKVKSDLTRAQLEALTIIAYRSPITKPELEEIRGVNCTRILRNLMMRGLIKEQEKKDRVVPEYVLSTMALQHLGISSTEELPDYEELNSQEVLEELLANQD